MRGRRGVLLTGAAEARENASGTSTAAGVISKRDYVAGLEAFGALGGLELDLLVLFEVAVPIAGDGAEMYEHVRAATVLGDETETLF
jgi:hypothetical protein